MLGQAPRKGLLQPGFGSSLKNPGCRLRAFRTMATGSASLSAALQDAYKDLVAYWPTAASQLPIVYHEKYNVSFFGIEKLHPFDACKFRKVVAMLEKQGLLKHQQLVTPLQATRETLADVHTQEYLEALHTSNLKVVQVTELPPLLMLPKFLVQWRVVTPMRYHAGGTMLAAGLAAERGWAINVGGGMHHAYSSNGMGWCPFDDIMLAIRRLRKASQGRIHRVLYIDLDAHQGNGVERDKLHFDDKDVFILDAYNSRVFPMDGEAEAAIDIPIRLRSGCSDATYLAELEKALQQATQQFPNPDLVFYNAGTDILAGDPLGRMAVSAQGIQTRDEMVWEYAMEKVKAPIVMTLSGGYAKGNAEVIAGSLANLMRRFNLTARGSGSTRPASLAGVGAAVEAGQQVPTEQ